MDGNLLPLPILPRPIASTTPSNDEHYVHTIWTRALSERFGPPNRPGLSGVLAYPFSCALFPLPPSLLCRHRSPARLSLSFPSFPFPSSQAEHPPPEAGRSTFNVQFRRSRPQEFFQDLDRIVVAIVVAIVVVVVVVVVDRRRATSMMRAHAGYVLRRPAASAVAAEVEVAVETEVAAAEVAASEVGVEAEVGVGRAEVAGVEVEAAEAGAGAGKAEVAEAEVGVGKAEVGPPRRPEVAVVSPAEAAAALPLFSDDQGT